MTAVYCRWLALTIALIVDEGVPVAKHPPTTNDEPGKEKQCNKSFTEATTPAGKAWLVVFFISAIGLSACLNAPSHAIDDGLK